MIVQDHLDDNEEIDDGSVTATVNWYVRQTGKGSAALDDGGELDLSEAALVCDDDVQRFLVSSQKIRLKKIEISPGNYIAAQIRNIDGEPISHEWQKGRITSWKSVPAVGQKGWVQPDDGGEKISFTETAVIGCPTFIWKAHCCYVVSPGGSIVAVCGVDGQPFPNSAADIVRPMNNREEKIKSRKPGEDYSKRYEIIQEPQPDIDGWPLPAIYRGKILFYHVSKNYGFITPVDSTNNQDPANIFFRKQAVAIKGLGTEPKIESGATCQFQVGVGDNGKPRACFVRKEDGSRFESDMPNITGIKRNILSTAPTYPPPKIVAYSTRPVRPQITNVGNRIYSRDIRDIRDVRDVRNNMPIHLRAPPRVNRLPSRRF